MSTWFICVFRGIATSCNRNRENSWFNSLFVRKVDPRKDAHSNLLTKNEESNLYKIQCKFRTVISIHHFEYRTADAFQTNISFQFIMSSQSAWMRTTNFGECCWYHSFLPSPRNGSCSSLRPRRPFTHLCPRSFGVVYSRLVINDPAGSQSSTARLCSYLTSLYSETYFQACCIRDNSQEPAINYMIVIWTGVCLKVNIARRLLFIEGLNSCIFPIHSEEVLPSIHADKYYPCELVGTWNTWYGEQDQAGRIIGLTQTLAV